MSVNPQALRRPAPVRLDWRQNLWIAGAAAVLVVAVLSRKIWLLNYVHVFFGALWTGTDLFMGFVLGPVLGRLDPAVRGQVVGRLIPRTLLYMPALSALTLTSGYYLATRLGLFRLPAPQSYWVLAAAILGLLLFLQGVGVLLPSNIRMFLENRKEKPDVEKIRRMMRRHLRFVGLQGLMQVVIVFIMSYIATVL